MSSLINTRIPGFEAANDMGKIVSDSDYLGKWLVLYFYPKDNTPGCTAEACSLRDNMESITALGCNVVGVSADTVDSHKNFKQRYGLNFSLIADVDKSICRKFDVLKEKSMFGKKFKGIERSTFLINPEGMVVYEWRKVKVGGHAAEVIEKLKEMMSRAAD